ncbi:MAG: CCA tRNA nucleotidyltransferase [Candidatus Omnitrophica bacterium]|nr:CCA tRNA nucleotidyltransferase [Candidatus Omnitrophota bacterium]
MKIDLTVLNKKTLSDLTMVSVQAKHLGLKAYLVGGVVRDMLLGRASSDLDIVVEGNAIELAKAIASCAKAHITVYKQFGTATVVFDNGVIMDFATARSESYLNSGALPIVKPGSIKEDLFRRDFTINALAVALCADNFGELQDFYGAYQDLQRKKISVLHEKSFLDDPTRILRAVRFEARLGFQIEFKTLSLLKKALEAHVEKTVKAPRYFAEFRKFFMEAHPTTGLRRLASLKGMNFIKFGFNPDWRTLSQVEKVLKKLKRDDFYSSKDWSTTFLLAFFSRATLTQISSYAKHFHLTKSELMSLINLPGSKKILKALQTKHLRPSEIYEILDPVDLEIIYFIRATTSVNMVARRLDQFLKKWRMVSLAINGEDLKDLGCKPGRKMGALLHRLLLNKIDGKIKSHRDEIDFAKRFGAVLFKN